MTALEQAGSQPADLARSQRAAPAQDERIARRIASELGDAALVNLGIGIPSLVARHLGREHATLLHAETGFIGYRLSGAARADNGWAVNRELIDASGNLLMLGKGAAIIGLSETFALMRSGRIDISVLGAYQVDQDGIVASVARSSERMRGFGGAMDLFVGARKIIVAMHQCDKRGRPKIVARLDMPRTAPRPADMIVTELAVFKVGPDGLVLVEIAEGHTLDEIAAVTPAAFTTAHHLTA